MERREILEIVAREWESASEPQVLRDRIERLFARDTAEVRQMARELAEEWLHELEEAGGAK